MIPPVAAAVFALAGCLPLDERQAGVMASATVAVPGAWSVVAPLFSDAPPALETHETGWRQFNDSRLERLIDAARSHAHDVRSAQARLRQARAARDLAVANLYPSLKVSAGVTRSRSGSGAGGSGESQTLYSAGFDASWEPSIFGGLTDAADAAKADAAAAEANLESARASLAAEVALEYVSLRAGQQRLAIVRANVDSQAETLQITECREMAGLVTRLDV